LRINDVDDLPDDAIDLKVRALDGEFNQKEANKVSEEVKALRNEISKCPWLDDETFRALADALISCRRVSESAHVKERSTTAGPVDLGDTCMKARAMLKEALGVSDVNDYLRTLKRTRL
jgi:hypothetical protein